MAVVVSLLAILGTIAFILMILVDTTILERAPDPSGKLVAILLTKDAGATTSTAYHVGITHKSYRLTDDKVVFIADKVDSSIGVKLKWTPTSLVITLPSDARIFRKRDTCTVDGHTIKIVYRLEH